MGLTTVYIYCVAAAFEKLPHLTATTELALVKSIYSTNTIPEAPGPPATMNLGDILRGDVAGEAPTSAVEQAASSYYMGVDVGTGSARVCLVDAAGIIKAVHSKETRTWNPSANYYVCWFISLVSKPRY